MKDKKETAKQIIECIGGKENIIRAAHCMTRLRINLVDESKADIERIKTIDGVMGVNVDPTSIQVIIGPAVDGVYNEFVELTGIEKQDKINENLDAPKKKLTAKGVFNNVLRAFTESMTPIIPTFVLIGMLSAIASLIGPSFFNLVTEDSAIYTNFYYVYQAVVYFLPVLVAVTSAEYFKCNKFFAMVLAFVMVYPDLITAIDSGVYTVYGIPVTSATYTSTLLPIIMCVWVMSYVQKLAEKISPDIIRVIFVPLFTILVMLPLELCIVGPIGNFIGLFLSNIMYKIYAISPVLELAIMGAITAFSTSFGFGRPLFFICLNQLLTTGAEYAFLPLCLGLGPYIGLGMLIAYFLKSKKPENKQTALSCFIAQLVGGVGEPWMFAVMLPNKSIIASITISGALQGALVGLLGVGQYVFGPSNVLAVIGFISESDPSNFTNGIIAAVAGVVIAFIVTFLLYKEEAKD